MSSNGRMSAGMILILSIPSFISNYYKLQEYVQGRSATVFISAAKEYGKDADEL